jgi:hypothetical protein
MKRMVYDNSRGKAANQLRDKKKKKNVNTVSIMIIKVSITRKYELTVPLYTLNYD